MHLLPAQTEAFESGRSVVRHQHIGPSQQRENDLMSDRRCQIDGHRPLAPVVEFKGRVDRAVEVPREAAEGVSGMWFDLDDLGAPVGQDRGAGWTGQPQTDLDDADILQRTSHTRFLSQQWPCRRIVRRSQAGWRASPSRPRTATGPDLLPGASGGSGTKQGRAGENEVTSSERFGLRSLRRSKHPRCRRR